jgi:ribosomal peptide maturation radical SAM protein 1
MFKIALINMPFSTVALPSIGLTQLKSVVDKRYGEQVSVDIHYINLDFAQYLGLQAHNMIMGLLDLNNTGIRDWFFRQAAFPQLEDNTEDYFRRYYPQASDQVQMYRQFIRMKRQGLDAFLDNMVTTYKLDEADIVGFTSMFHQTVSSFALARKIKERNPNVITVIGGANCESPMGQEIAKNVEQINFVFSGPGLVSFTEFVGCCLDKELAKRHRINGVFSKANCEAPIPQASLGEFKKQSIIGDELDLDASIELDYDPFLASIDRHFPNGEVQGALLFETSRGCWWGEKAHCTFCGLNGMTMKYRSMNSQNAVKQIESLFKYAGRVTRIDSVDNIMPKNYLTEVFPNLNTPPELSIFYEVKADLSEEDVQVLAKARVTKIQPGIEALATSTLKLMKKGTSVFQNLTLLRYCALYGVSPVWNLLLGFPGEEEEVYRKYVEDLPLLTHLPPPDGAFPVRFDRYSPYFVKAKEYGLDLHPVDYYSLIYPFSKDSLVNLAYYFSDHNLNAKYANTMISWLGKVRDKWEYWYKRWNDNDDKVAPRLYLKTDAGKTTVYDSRNGEAKEYAADEVTVQVLELLNKPKRLADLAKNFGHIPDFDPERAITVLQERGWIFQEHDRYMNLVLPREPATMPAH